jgi:hypothetical protein
MQKPLLQLAQIRLTRWILCSPGERLLKVCLDLRAMDPTLVVGNELSELHYPNSWLSFLYQYVASRVLLAKGDLAAASDCLDDCHKPIPNHAALWHNRGLHAIRSGSCGISSIRRLTAFAGPLNSHPTRLQPQKIRNPITCGVTVATPRASRT